MLAVLILVSLTLITVDVRGGDDGPMAGLRSFAGSVFGPVQQAAAVVVSPVQDFVERVSEGDQERLDRLERENAELLTQLRTTELARARAQELDDLLRVAGIGQYTIVPAQVIAIGAAQDFAWAVTIDAGSRDGITADMTVLNGDGLVGRVKTVSLTTATVLLAIDPTSSVGARLEETLELGVATGRGDEPMELQVLDPQTPLAEGDRIVTFGSAGGTPFVPGVPIGTVRAVSSTPGSLVRVAAVEPFVNFSALDLVGVVVQPPRADPRDAILPPAPTAAG